MHFAWQGAAADGISLPPPLLHPLSISTERRQSRGQEPDGHLDAENSGVTLVALYSGRGGSEFPEGAAPEGQSTFSDSTAPCRPWLPGQGLCFQAVLCTKEKCSLIAQELFRAGAGLQIDLTNMVTSAGGRNIYNALLCVQRCVTDFSQSLPFM